MYYSKTKPPPLFYLQPKSKPANPHWPNIHQRSKEYKWYIIPTAHFLNDQRYTLPLKKADEPHIFLFADQTIETFSLTSSWKSAFFGGLTPFVFSALTRGSRGLAGTLTGEWKQRRQTAMYVSAPPITSTCKEFVTVKLSGREVDPGYLHVYLSLSIALYHLHHKILSRPNRKHISKRSICRVRWDAFKTFDCCSLPL